jgi:hypothetical protein
MRRIVRVGLFRIVALVYKVVGAIDYAQITVFVSPVLLAIHVQAPQRGAIFLARGAAREIGIIFRHRGVVPAER